MYIKLSDQILKAIPGPHLEEMDTWPKFSFKGSPPVPGNLYPNPKYVPGYKPKERSKAKSVAPKQEIAKKEPAISESPEGPTLVDKPVPSAAKDGTQMIDDLPAEVKTLDESPAKEMLADVLADGEPEENMVEGAQVTENSNEPFAGLPVLGPLPPQTEIELLDSGPIPEPLSSNVLPVQPEEEEVKGLLLPAPEAEAVDEIASVTSSSESLDVDAAMGEIKGLRPDLTTIGNVENGIQSPSGIAKHFLVMGGTS